MCGVARGLREELGTMNGILIPATTQGPLRGWGAGWRGKIWAPKYLVNTCAGSAAEVPQCRHFPLCQESHSLEDPRMHLVWE